MGVNYATRKNRNFNVKKFESLNKRNELQRITENYLFQNCVDIVVECC